MPELASLDAATQSAVRKSTERLRHYRDVWIDDFLMATRAHVPGYAVLSDEEIRESARSFLDGELDELVAFRIPDDALRDRLEVHAQRRIAQGVSLETLTMAYQLGSRELLSLMDRIAAEVGLPNDLLLAVHDSTWEFANEASAVFARVQREVSVERARFDAERRSGFARAVLTGTLPAEQIARDAHLFGLEPHGSYVAVAARTGDTAGAGDEVRRAIARAQRIGADRLLAADVGSTVGAIVSTAALGDIPGHLVGVSDAVPLGELHDAFEEALVALETGERFALEGAVRLADLGPRPLVLAAERTARQLDDRLFAALDAARSGSELRETARVYLACDQVAADAAAQLVVHPNTVRYRMRRFAELTGLDLRRTEDLFTAWWLLNRR